MVFGVAMGLAVQALGSITCAGIVFSKKSYLKLYGYGTMIAVAAIAIPLLSSAFGFAGVAWGSMTAYFAKTGVETWMAQRVHSVAWDFKAPVALGCITLLVGTVHQIAYQDAGGFNGNPAPLLGLAVLLVVAWLIAFNNAARSRMRTLLRPKRVA